MLLEEIRVDSKKGKNVKLENEIPTMEELGNRKTTINKTKEDIRKIKEEYSEQLKEAKQRLKEAMSLPK